MSLNTLPDPVFATAKNMKKGRHVVTTLVLFQRCRPLETALVKQPSKGAWLMEACDALTVASGRATGQLTHSRA
jgi:hypothetical protein